MPLDNRTITGLEDILELMEIFEDGGVSTFVSYETQDEHGNRYSQPTFESAMEHKEENNGRVLAFARVTALIPLGVRLDA